MRVRLNIHPYWTEGLKIGEVANAIGINPKALTAIRRGTERGEWATLVKLARYFNVTIEQLLEIEE